MYTVEELFKRKITEWIAEWNSWDTHNEMSDRQY